MEYSLRFQSGSNRFLSSHSQTEYLSINNFILVSRQLLHYNVTNLEQERALKESQRLYSTLKEFIVKLPSIKIKEELNEVKVS